MLALVALASTTLLSGCTGPRTDGPISFTAEASRVCGPLPAFSDAALGINLPDHLPAGIVIKSVEPTGVAGVDIGDIYLMPAADPARLLLDVFPPMEETPNSWKHAVPAIGAVLPTDTSYDLVIEVKANGAGGGFDSTRIRYSLGGEDFETTSYLGVTLSPISCI